MNGQQRSFPAVLGALRLISGRPSNAVDKSAFVPRMVSAADGTTREAISGVGAFEQWDNYDDHNQFPNAKP